MIHGHASKPPTAPEKSQSNKCRLIYFTHGRSLEIKNLVPVYKFVQLTCKVFTAHRNTTFDWQKHNISHFLLLTHYFTSVTQEPKQLGTGNCFGRLHNIKTARTHLTVVWEIRPKLYIKIYISYKIKHDTVWLREQWEQMVLKGSM